MAKQKELTEEEFFTQRKEQLVEAVKNGLEPYPHKYNVTDSIADIRELAGRSGTGEVGTEKVQSAGRIITIRGHGKLFFFTVESGDSGIQLVLNNGSKNIYETAELIRRGDIVGFSGLVGRSKTGELSVFLSELVLLSPCLRVIPSFKSGLANPETIYRKRHVDLLVNKESRRRFITRSKVIQYIRSYLVNKGFLEVETPMMNPIHGGAAAKPFKTFHNELKMDLFLRVAPELYLKKLVIGGLEKVFEVGKQFRNEGIDLTHNPEFTTVEFYEAYKDHNDMMEHVEEMLSGMVLELKGSTEYVYEIIKRGTEEKTSVNLSFSRPFKRLDILTELNRILGVELTGENLTNPETLNLLLECASSRGLVLEAPQTLNRVLDLFIGEYIEPQCKHPTFVTGFPAVTSPLAKSCRSRPGITERFELFVNGKEIANAYTELNIPEVQRERFMQQSADANAGDAEAMPTDEDYCQALEYGLAPVGGCGIGIDRLVMYLTDASNIRDVLFFPAMRPEN